MKLTEKSRWLILSSLRESLQIESTSIQQLKNTRNIELLSSLISNFNEILDVLDELEFSFLLIDWMQRKLFRREN